MRSLHCSPQVKQMTALVRDLAASLYLGGGAAGPAAGAAAPSVPAALGGDMAAVRSLARGRTENQAAHYWEHVQCGYGGRYFRQFS